MRCLGALSRLVRIVRSSSSKTTRRNAGFAFGWRLICRILHFTVSPHAESGDRYDMISYVKAVDIWVFTTAG